MVFHIHLLRKMKVICLLEHKQLFNTIGEKKSQDSFKIASCRI